jgi:hypothetical protein
MSSRTIELFRQYTHQDRLKHESEHKAQKPLGPSEQTKTARPNLIVEMSRMEHAVRQMFDDASADERDNIIRFLEVMVRNLKRVREVNE